jgi:hypothetical protein
MASFVRVLKRVLSIPLNIYLLSISQANASETDSFFEPSSLQGKEAI